VQNKRKRIWIDRFQTYLFIRIALYCVLSQMAVWFILLICQHSYAAAETMLGPGAAPSSFVVSALILTFLSFLLIYDSLKFAHRFVGPLYRFRKTIQAITSGEEVVLIQLRKGDLLQDMKQDINEMLKALEQRGAIVVKDPRAIAEEKQPVSV
jgi:hypothetical protein